jgi:hypothetical protein
VAPGQTYGAAGQQAAAQQTIPLPQQRQVPQGPPPAPNPIEMQLAVAPGLDAPSARPDEPLTHGLKGGPGAGPEILEFNRDDFDVVLREMYRTAPNTELLELIGMWERAHPY